MKKVLAILTAAFMLTTVSFAQQSQTDTTHKSAMKKSGHTHSTMHKMKADTARKSSAKKP